MIIFRRAELISGIVTGLSTVVSFSLLMTIQFGFASATDILGWLLLYGLPGLLLGWGAYSHSVRHKSWGLKVILVIAGLSAILILVAFFGGVIGYLGVSTALSWLMPAIMSVLTGISAIVVALSEKRNRLTL